MRNAGLDEAQVGIKIAGRNTNNLRYADDNHPYGTKWRGTKKPLDESESVSRSVSHSALSDSVTPQTIADQAPLCMEFSVQEYLSG